MFVQNVSWFSMDNTVYIPGDRTIQGHNLENLKSYNILFRPIMHRQYAGGSNFAAHFDCFSYRRIGIDIKMSVMKSICWNERELCTEHKV
jgi:hypothetical protein